MEKVCVIFRTSESFCASWRHGCLSSPRKFICSAKVSLKSDKVCGRRNKLSEEETVRSQKVPNLKKQKNKKNKKTKKKKKKKDNNNNTHTQKRIHKSTLISTVVLRRV